MIDREKVIRGLECCMASWMCSDDCPYQKDPGNNCCQMFSDALELLKEQEPAEPMVEQYALPITRTSVRFIKKYYCGICKEGITGNNVYCHKCGRKVRWPGDE